MLISISAKKSEGDKGVKGNTVQLLSLNNGPNGIFNIIGYYDQIVIGKKLVFILFFKGLLVRGPHKIDLRPDQHIPT